jgi:hypothetical protein
LGTVGISSSGTSIHTSVATLNFVGAGNTFAVHNDQVDITIEGGGTKAGEAINYPSGTKSPFILNSTHITESITLNDSNTDTGVANIVTAESMLTVDDSVTITVEDGKTVVPDLFDVFG